MSIVMLLEEAGRLGGGTSLTAKMINFAYKCKFQEGLGHKVEMPRKNMIGI